MAWEPGATIKVVVAVPVLYPFAGFLPTTCALPKGALPSKNVTVPPVAALLLVVTVAVIVIFPFTLAGLGETERAMVLTEARPDKIGDSWAVSAAQNKERPATRTAGSFNR